MVGSRFDTAKTITRVIVDTLAFIFGGGPGGAIAADELVSGGFDIGKSINDYFNPPPQPANRGIQAPSFLPSYAGNKNIPITLKRDFSRPIIQQFGVSSPTRQFTYGVSKEPIIEVLRSMKKNSDLDFVSDQNSVPNPAFATSGFKKIRLTKPKEKIYKVVI